MHCVFHLIPVFLHKDRLLPLQSVDKYLHTRPQMHRTSHLVAFLVAGQSAESACVCLVRVTNVNSILFGNVVEIIIVVYN